MNIIAKSVTSLARVCLGRVIEGSSTSLVKSNYVNSTRGSILEAARKCFESSMSNLQQIRTTTTLRKLHEKGYPFINKKKKKKNPLDGKPFMKGVVLKTLVRKPKKPNSANRKCVLLRLSSGKEMTAYIPGIGHNLQEHNIVLVRNGRCKDTPGVKIKCVRGKYDLAHVIKERKF